MAWKVEKHVMFRRYEMEAHERAVFRSVFGNLPEGLKSLFLVAEARDSNLVEVFGMRDLLREGLLPSGLCDLKVLLCGSAAAQCEGFINQSLSEWDPKLTVGTWDMDAAFKEYREDFPDEEEEDDYGIDLYDD